jgi:hypothetical protein
LERHGGVKVLLSVVGGMRHVASCGVVNLVSDVENCAQSFESVLRGLCVREEEDKDKSEDDEEKNRFIHKRKWRSKTW